MLKDDLINELKKENRLYIVNNNIIEVFTKYMEHFSEGIKTIIDFNNFELYRVNADNKIVNYGFKKMCFNENTNINLLMYDLNF